MNHLNLNISFSMFMFLQHSFKKVIASNLSAGFIHVGIFLNMYNKILPSPAFFCLKERKKAPWGKIINPKQIAKAIIVFPSKAFLPPFNIKKNKLFIIKLFYVLAARKNLLASGNSYVKATIDINIVSDLAHVCYCGL